MLVVGRIIAGLAIGIASTTVYALSVLSDRELLSNESFLQAHVPGGDYCPRNPWTNDIAAAMGESIRHMVKCIAWN